MKPAHQHVRVVVIKGQVTVEKAEHEQAGRDEGRGNELGHASRRGCLGFEWNDVVERDGDHPVEDALQKGNVRTEVLKLKVGLEKGERGRVFRDGTNVVHDIESPTQKHGPGDSGHEDTHNFQSKGREQQEPRDALGNPYQPRIRVLGVERATVERLVNGGNHSSRHEGRRSAQVGAPVVGSLHEIADFAAAGDEPVGGCRKGVQLASTATGRRQHCPSVWQRRRKGLHRRRGQEEEYRDTTSRLHGQQKSVSSDPEMSERGLLGLQVINNPTHEDLFVDR